MSDDEQDRIDPEAHKRLLKAIGNLSKNECSTKYERNENKLSPGEFNLYKGVEVETPIGNDGLEHPGLRKTNNKNRHQAVAMNDIVKVLNRNEKYLKTGKHVKDDNAKKAVLPKPLEKPVTDRIKRTIGYEKLQQKLARRDANVAKNRNADSQVFPSKEDTIYVKSDLMKRMEETGNKLKALKSKNCDNEETPERSEKDKEKWLHKKLTRDELIARRRELNYLRMCQSSKSAKARLSNRINSRKYHKLLKQKLRKEMENFELLQKTNPEAALEKLNALEKSRILERASLRDKNTGLWAPNMKVRAKYNKEVREDLASRQLMRKLQASDDSEDGENEDENESVSNETHETNSSDDGDPLDPWMKDTSKQSNADQSGGVGWLKYWLEQYKQMKSSENVGISEDENESVSNETHETNSSDDGDPLNPWMKDTRQQSNADQSGLESWRKCWLEQYKQMKSSEKEDISDEFPKGKQKKIGKDVEIPEGGEDISFDELFNESHKRIEETMEKKMNASKKYDLPTMQKKKGGKNLKKARDKLKNLKDLSFKEQVRGPKLDEELVDNTQSESISDLKRNEGRLDDLNIIEQNEVAMKNNNKNFKKKVRATLKTIKPNVPAFDLNAHSNNTNLKKPGVLHLNVVLDDVAAMEDDDKSIDSVENPELAMAEASADDDIVADFYREKKEESALKNKEITLDTPDWDFWGGPGISKEDMKDRPGRRIIYHILPREKRRDKNRDTVSKKEGVAKHVRSVITKKGNIIEPMDDNELVKVPSKPVSRVDVRHAEFKKNNQKQKPGGKKLKCESRKRKAERK